MNARPPVTSGENDTTILEQINFEMLYISKCKDTPTPPLNSAKAMLSLSVMRHSRITDTAKLRLRLRGARLLCSLVRAFQN